MSAPALVDALRNRNQTVSFCESLTAGLAAATLATVPGASAVLRGGLVTYATEVKSHFLSVPVEELEAQGVVSAKTAQAMAEAAVRETGADWGLSLTGVAGPDPQEGKSAGTVFVGIVGPGVPARGIQLEQLSGSRNAIREAAVEEVLSLLLSTLEEY